MSNYKSIVEKALEKAKGMRKTEKPISEGILYPEGMTEKLHPNLEDELEKSHSLKGSPIFPEDDENTFEEKLVGERFSDVVKLYKRVYDVNSINNRDVMMAMSKLLADTMKIESGHEKELEELAIRMVCEEFDIDPDVIDFHAELTHDINMLGTKKNKKPTRVDIEFKNHSDIVNAKAEVYKRRFVNAMIQGASMKANHMFRMVEDDLVNIDPRLANRYPKLMASADYLYFVVPDLSSAVNGGVVRVKFHSKNNPKPAIYAQAMVFPILVHELIKGIMELISAHGLPKDKKIGEYVINKADFLTAEPWDMRLGAALWERFTTMIDVADFPLKHHIYTDLVSLPVNEFNEKMREIIAGTKEGKKIINSIVKNVKKDLSNDEFNDAMSGVNDDSNAYDFDELMGDEGEEDEGWEFDDLV